MNVCTYSCGNIPCDGSVHDENIVGKTMARSAISRLIPTNLTDSGLIIGIRDLGLEPPDTGRIFQHRKISPPHPGEDVISKRYLETLYLPWLPYPFWPRTAAAQ